MNRIQYTLVLLAMFILVIAIAQKIDALETRCEALQSIINKQGLIIKKLKKEAAAPQISRSEFYRKVTSCRVTAYSIDSCNKRPEHPLYGVTKSGVKAVSGRTIAMSEDTPFGTMVYIPHFKKTFVVEDRGSAIKKNCVDILMEDNKKCFEFGIKYLDIYILK